MILGLTSHRPDAPAPQSVPEISRDEIHARLGDPSLLLLNVLPRAAFAAGHIPGSLSLPVPEIPERAREVLSDGAREVAVYCAGPT
ncbi:MAG: rhodanese-like domain-containing protein [candidate division NC10 bacterium]|nr:rhodanese-like domain-containing protein [candidate division NC10 bacterium]